MRKIGLDYDFKDIDFIRSILSNIILEFSPSVIELYISPCGRGYHIKFSVDDSYSDEDLLKIRKFFYDDEARISMVDGVYRDVLFDIKVVDGKVMKARRLDLDSFLFCGIEREY